MRLAVDVVHRVRADVPGSGHGRRGIRMQGGVLLPEILGQRYRIGPRAVGARSYGGRWRADEALRLMPARRTPSRGRVADLVFGEPLYQADPPLRCAAALPPPHGHRPAEGPSDDSRRRHPAAPHARRWIWGMTPGRLLLAAVAAAFLWALDLDHASQPSSAAAVKVIELSQPG